MMATLWQLYLVSKHFKPVKVILIMYLSYIEWMTVYSHFCDQIRSTLVSLGKGNKSALTRIHLHTLSSI